MPANDYQVGGLHYKTSAEHWDMIIDTGACYFTGCATKYVARWRKKGGVEDLKKALHYTNKLIETVQLGKPSARTTDIHSEQRRDLVLHFAKVNGLSELEELICLELIDWKLPSDLIKARDLILELIPDEENPSEAAT